jgi:alpha-N-acetylglucosamine transferase
MLDKFQILKYHDEYDRIIFLDSDITPFCNLDYMFKGSLGPDPIFAPNVVLSYKREPAQGGFFMIHPEKGDYERLQEIIDHRIHSSYNFSEEYGWGHKIEPPDVWDSMNDKNQTKWDWYGACKFLTLIVFRP